MFAAGGASNYVRFRLSPDVLITIGAQVKRAGEAMVSEPAEFTVVHHPEGDEMDAYERLLGDALDGDTMLFAARTASRPHGGSSSRCSASNARAHIRARHVGSAGGRGARGRRRRLANPSA